MMASVVAARSIRDGKIPSGSLPLIILHWGHEHYQGVFSPLDMRKFLEQKLRDGSFAPDVIQVWVNQSEAWAFLMDQQQKGAVDRLLAQYFQVHLAA